MPMPPQLLAQLVNGSRSGNRFGDMGPGSFRNQNPMQPGPAMGGRFGDMGPGSFQRTQDYQGPQMGGGGGYGDFGPGSFQRYMPRQPIMPPTNIASPQLNDPRRRWNFGSGSYPRLGGGTGNARTPIMPRQQRQPYQMPYAIQPYQYGSNPYLPSGY